MTYDPGVRAVVMLLLVTACGGSPRTQRAAAPAPPHDTTEWAVAEPPPPRSLQAPERTLGSDLFYRDPQWIAEELARERGRETVVIERRFGRFGTLEPAESDFWSPCVRDIVLQQPEPARRALTALVANYATSCDGAGSVILERPLGLDGREHRALSGIALVGTVGRQIDVALRVTYCGAVTDLDHVVLIASDTRWTSQRLELVRDADNCLSADIAVTRAVERTARALTDAPASLRFEGARGYDTVALDEDALRVLRIALDSLDALR